MPVAAVTATDKQHAPATQVPIPQGMQWQCFMFTHKICRESSVLTTLNCTYKSKERKLFYRILPSHSKSACHDCTCRNINRESTTESDLEDQTAIGWTLMQAKCPRVHPCLELVRICVPFINQKQGQSYSSHKADVQNHDKQLGWLKPH